MYQTIVIYYVLYNFINMPDKNVIICVEIWAKGSKYGTEYQIKLFIKTFKHLKFK
jgi:hypothetical protein